MKGKRRSWPRGSYVADEPLRSEPLSGAALDLRERALDLAERTPGSRKTAHPDASLVLTGGADRFLSHLSQR
jgi:hypothetical protein